MPPPRTLKARLPKSTLRNSKDLSVDEVAEEVGCCVVPPGDDFGTYGKAVKRMLKPRVATVLSSSCQILDIKYRVALDSTPFSQQFVRKIYTIHNVRLKHRGAVNTGDTKEEHTPNTQAKVSLAQA